MSRKFVRLMPFAALAIGGALWMSVRTPAQTSPSGLSGTSNGEWTAYHGDLRSHHYSPLAEVDGSNFNKLEVAWRFKTDHLGPRPEYGLEGVPMAIGNTLYTTGGTRRSVIALNSMTGELLWVHGENEGKRAMVAPRQMSGRGVSYWTDGKGDERIFYTTIGYRLVALNAKTGTPIASFGKNGIIDLKEAAVYGNRQPIDRETGEIGVNSTPVVTKSGVVLIGSAFKEGATPKTVNNTKGIVQAFDARTGKRLWNFHTIPRPGEFGNETWENDSWAVNGNTGVWNQMSVDEELGLIYIPVESPTSDHYGGTRPGNNLFADSLVCLDLKTGQRKWHYQLVHHPLWNFDTSTAPILMDIVVDGRPIKAVSIMSKAAFIYVFDRVTGQPVWPIEERPVPQSDVPGEKTSPTQPHPTKPPAYDRQAMTKDELIDFTPELRAEAEQIVKWYKLGDSLFSPPVLSKPEGPLATLRLSGGTNMPGGAYDPETHILYTGSEVRPGNNVGLITPPKDMSDARYVAGNALVGYRYVATQGEGTGGDNLRTRTATAVGGRGGAAAQEGGGGGRNRGNVPGVPPNVLSLTVQGLPIVKPPYGQISAINMDRGEILWQVAHGDTPDFIRNHPALKGLQIPRTGQVGAGHIGVLVTKTLVIGGDAMVTTTDAHPRGAMLRAYDKATGKEVGAVWMPAPQDASPMTYKAEDGHQYIFLGVAGGNYSGEYIAFRLPENP